MRTHKTDLRSCPCCKAPLNSMTNTSGEGAPRLGDLTICAYCAARLQVAEAGYRELDDAAFKALPAEARRAMTEARGTVMLFNRFAGAPPSYLECLKKMTEGAAVFLRKHGAIGLAFRLPPDGMVVAAALQSPALEALAANEKSCEFLRQLDEASEHEATIEQACGLAELTGCTIEEGRDQAWAPFLTQGGEPS